MIPCDFEYYRPETATEAVGLYFELADRGKDPFYYGGGTEIISFCRLYQLSPRAVIDVKAIPELNILEQSKGKIKIGAAKTLSQIQESNIFPLLSQCGGKVADHTIRNKITLGGNLCAAIPYREASLALLVSDAELVVENKKGERKIPINTVFQETLGLEKGELLKAVQIGKEYPAAPFVSLKKTSDGNVGYPQDRVGYPLVSAAALKTKDRVQVAFSGLCPFPFRSPALEAALNENNRPRDMVLEQVLKSLPAGVKEDTEGSAAYRRFALKNMLDEILERLVEDN